MKRFALLLVVVMWTVIGLSGCATYGAKGVMPNIADSSVCSVDKLSTKMGDGIVVTAYPLTTKEEAEKYFDQDLLDDGIVAIFVEIQNENPAKIVAASFNPSDGMFSSPMAADDVYSVMKKNPWGRGVFWYFAGLYVGGPISALATYKTNQRIEGDLKGGKLLSIGNIPKGTTSGFMCFRLGEKPPALKGTLKLVFVDNNGRLLEYNLPM